MTSVGEKAKAVVERLKIAIPRPETELHYQNAYQLAVAVALSAQCTDKRVNQTTPALFARYPDFFALAQAETEELFALIKSISYPNNKTKNLVAMAKNVVEKHGGVLPDNRADLEALPGVGRKTANVLLSVLHGLPTMAVDTHVFRVARRIGLASGKTPVAVEKQLVELIEPADVPAAHHWFILHGRYVCLARKPKCGQCTLSDLCDDYQRRATPV